jgi:hypothetical protein
MYPLGTPRESTTKCMSALARSACSLPDRPGRPSERLGEQAVETRRSPAGGPAAERTGRYDFTCSICDCSTAYQRDGKNEAGVGRKMLRGWNDTPQSDSSFNHFLRDIYSSRIPQSVISTDERLIRNTNRTRYSIQYSRVEFTHTQVVLKASTVLTQTALPGLGEPVLGYRV